MNWKEISHKYDEIIDKDLEKYQKDYEKLIPEIESSKALFRNKVVPFSYKPVFYTEEDIENFKEIGKTMLKIGDKVVDEYIRNQEFRRKFDFPKELEDLIVLDNGYDVNVPMARLDIFYEDRENFKFVELNTDGSSAMLEDNSFAEISYKTRAIEEMEEDFEFFYFELIDSWVKKSMDIYYDLWQSDHKVGEPNIAILDYRESATGQEFEEFKMAYERMGYRTRIVDPRDLEYRDGSLYDGDFEINMVYRRLVTSEMLGRTDEIKDFLDAYRDGKICLIGSFRSQLIHNKMIFKVLHDSDTKELFTEREIEFIEKHIPYTGEFTGDLKKLDYLKENKDKFIMKPSDMNVGKGVYAGRDLSQEDWERELEKSFNKDYIFQEFIEPSPRTFYIYEDGSLKKLEYNAVIGLFMYNEEFAGLYTRIGRDNVISSFNAHRAANFLAIKK